MTHVNINKIFVADRMDDTFDDMVPGYLELKEDFDGITPYMIACLLFDRIVPNISRTVTVYTADDEFDLEPALYNKVWRFWFKKPSIRDWKNDKWD